MCAKNHTEYYWSPTSSEKLKDLVKDNCPVVGGWDAKVSDERGFSEGTLYIGRKRYQDELIIGNIAAYSLEIRGLPLMYFPYDGEELNTTHFEILMFTPSPTANYTGDETVFNLDVIPVDN